ncbi:hypothetical protein [Nitrosomonas sp. Nm166]|uniref:hypothetical protein n=1 Tax=Nitrosomonas sp. Nm166 TaxID=1881054 RepID=UPI0008E6EC07|nr:hypothetical protein [Nitrosomonas sp. Nm166]SFE69197.1 hypothetical protein SAMN05428977_10261 [Nitrosomonas sp. Nm166]
MSRLSLSFLIDHESLSFIDIENDLGPEREAVRKALGGDCTVVESYTADERVSARAVWQM